MKLKLKRPQKTVQILLSALSLFGTLILFNNCSASHFETTTLSEASSSSLSSLQPPASVTTTTTLPPLTTTSTLPATTTSTLPGPTTTTVRSPSTTVTSMTTTTTVTTTTLPAATTTSTTMRATTTTTLISNPPPSGTSPGVLVLVGYGGRKMVSTDKGLSWAQDRSDIANGQDDPYLWRAVNYANGLYVAVGSRIQTSRDGITWTAYNTDGGQWLGGVVYGNNRWVASGGCGPRMYSNDGVQWQLIPNYYISTNGCGHFRSLAFGNGLFVSVGDGGLKGISSDGIQWTHSYGTSYEHIVFGLGFFYATSGNQILRSADGNTWQAVPGLASGSFQALSFSNGTLYFSTSDRIYASKNGTTWTTYNASLGAKIFDMGGVYFAMSWNVYYRSTDLINWTRTNLSGNALEAGVYSGP